MTMTNDLVRVRVRSCEMTTYDGVVTMARAKFELLRGELACGDVDAAQEVHELLLLGSLPMLGATEPEQAQVLAFELDDTEVGDGDETEGPTGQEA